MSADEQGASSEQPLQIIKNLIHMDIKMQIDTCKSLVWANWVTPPILEKHADDCLCVGNYGYAYLLYLSASVSYFARNPIPPTYVLERVELCIKNIKRAVEDGNLTNVDYLSGIHEMVRNLAFYYQKHGHTHYDVKKYGDAREYFSRGRDLMNTHFGHDVDKHKLFGRILRNLADIEFKLENTGAASVMYEKAIAVFERAEDYTEEVEKSDDIVKCKNLKISDE